MTSPDYTTPVPFSYLPGPEQNINTSDNTPFTNNSVQGRFGQYSVEATDRSTNIETSVNNLCLQIIDSGLIQQKKILEYTVNQINGVTDPSLSVQMVCKQPLDEIHDQLEKLSSDKNISGSHKYKQNRDAGAKTLEQLKLKLTGEAYKILYDNYKKLKGDCRLIRIINAAKITRGIAAHDIVKAVQNAGFPHLVTNYLEPAEGARLSKRFATLNRDIHDTIPEHAKDTSRYSSCNSLSAGLTPYEYKTSKWNQPNSTATQLQRSSSFGHHLSLDLGSSSFRRVNPPTVPERRTTSELSRTGYASEK